MVADTIWKSLPIRTLPPGEKGLLLTFREIGTAEQYTTRNNTEGLSSPLCLAVRHRIFSCTLLVPDWHLLLCGIA